MSFSCMLSAPLVFSLERVVGSPDEEDSKSVFYHALLAVLTLRIKNVLLVGNLLVPTVEFTSLIKWSS